MNLVHCRLDCNSVTMPTDIDYSQKISVHVDPHGLLDDQPPSGQNRIDLDASQGFIVAGCGVRVSWLGT